MMFHHVAQHRDILTKAAINAAFLFLPGASQVIKVHYLWVRNWTFNVYVS